MPSLSQPFTITPIPRQSTPSPIFISSHGLVPNTNELDIAISRYSISKFLVHPTPKLVHSTAIPSNQIITAFNNDVYGSSQSKHSNFLHLNQDTKIAVPCPVVNCMPVKDKNDIVNTTVILKDGTIQRYKDIVLESTKKIPYSDIIMAEYIDERYVVIISPSIVTVYDLNTITELRSKNNITVEDSSFKLFKGKLYKYNEKTFTFEIYDVTTLNLLHTVTIPFIEENTKSVTYAVVGEFRVVLTVNNLAYLLDLHLGSVITTITFKHLKWFKLLTGVDASFVLGISCTSNSGELKLEIVNVELGSCNLKDSLGKSFKNFVKNSNEQDKSTKPMSLLSLIPSSKAESPRSFDYAAILEKLNENAQNKDKFDAIFFKDLMIEEDCYTEKDRFIINQRFLSDVLDLILKNFKFNDSGDYPKALAFLLTHPLFPIQKTKGLLATFKEEPTLYKQTIVTCPNLPLEELLTELFSIKNDELSLDISLRILEDYTTDAIKESLKRLPKVDIENYIEFVIVSDSDKEVKHSADITKQLLELLSLIIDSVGLFALEGKLLESLTVFINEKTRIAERNTDLWYLVEHKTTDFASSHSTNNSTGTSVQKKKKLPAYTVEYLDL